MRERSKRKAAASGAPTIPDKQAFKIGEVSRIIAVKPHVLRYWETEFPAFRPRKSRTNQRLYSRQDVQTALLIKRLLYQEGFTIAGANRRLRELSRQKPCPAEGDFVRIIERVRREVRALLEVVEPADSNDQ